MIRLDLKQYKLLAVHESLRIVLSILDTIDLKLVENMRPESSIKIRRAKIDLLNAVKEFKIYTVDSND